MRQVTYTDTDGRKWQRLLPDSAPDSDARKGVPLGPPSLEPLNLEHDFEVRLHNALFNRGLITADDVRLRPNEVAAALMSALRLDTQTIQALY